MTITTTYAPAQYNGNGVTTVFSFPYVFFNDTDLLVTLTLISTGVDTVQVLGTNYSVTGGDGDVGSVTFTVAPPTGYRVTIELSLPYTQEDNYVENQAFPAETLESGFDKAVIRDQQLLSLANKSLKFPSTLSGSLSGVLPVPEDGKLLVWDGTTGAIGNADIADISTSINTVITSVAIGDVLYWDGTNWANQTVGENIGSVGILKNDGTTVTAAAQGVDYYAPSGTDVAVADGGTNISSYTAGDILYATGATTLAKLAIGTSGKALVSSGTAPTWGDYSAFTIGSRIAASGFDIEKTGITANAKRIIILLDGLSSNGAGAIQVILGNSGGYETSGYVGAASQSSASVATSNISSGFAIASTTSAASVYSGMIVLQKGAGNTWYCSGVLGRSDAAVTTYLGGYKTLSATLDRVKLNASGDTFDAGGVTYVVEV